jgi:Glycosyltransferase family 87
MIGQATAESRSVKYLRDLLLGVLPILFALQCFGWLTFLPSALRGHADFRQLYAAGYMIRTGHSGELYDYQAQKKVQDELVGADELALPFIRPAYQALLFVPFSLLAYRTAYLAFLGVNLLLLTLTFLLLRAKLTNVAAIWSVLPVCVFLVFYPLALALLQGQDSILLLVLLTAALILLERGRELSAGALVAFGLFKLQIVIPIALLFLLWRRWRFTAGFALSAALVSLASLLTAGLAQTFLFVRALLSVGGVAGNQISFPLRVSFMANLRGLISGLTQFWLPPSWMQALTIFASAAVLIAMTGSALRKQQRENQLIFAITASVLVSYYVFIHDLSVLLIPLALTLDRFLGLAQARNLDGATAWTAALLLVAPMWIFLRPDHFYLVALPLCAFMVLLTYRAQRDGVVPVEQASGELDRLH